MEGIIVVVIMLVWLLPFFVILGSNKVVRGEKVAWVLAVFLISWLAFIFFLLLAPIKKK